MCVSFTSQILDSYTFRNLEGSGQNGKSQFKATSVMVMVKDEQHSEDIVVRMRN